MVDRGRLENKKICVAVSGGVDSVALLHYLKAGEKAGGYILSAIHCEHGIRGEESLADMRFVEELCKEWEIPLVIEREDCPARAKREKVSLETAARNFRYEKFAALLAAGQADYIATAHHKGDMAETVLFRLARGSGLTGASGIRRETEGYLRPFLDKSKQEILDYAKTHGLSHREDSTNWQTDATRNKIRLEILPKLEEAVPRASENLIRFAALAKEDDELLGRLAFPLLTREENLPAVRFEKEKPLFTRACIFALKEAGLDKDYTSTHLADLYALQDLERGASLTLPRGYRARKGKRGVLFYRESDAPLPAKGEEKPFAFAPYDGGRYAVNVEFDPPTKAGEWATLRADGEKIPKSARFRFRREGDYIYRFGGGRKSLKKFFNEEKIPPFERDYLPLIADDNGEVYAVCGVEISGKIAVDSGTKKQIYITIRKKEKDDE